MLYEGAKNNRGRPLPVQSFWTPSINIHDKFYRKSTLENLSNKYLNWELFVASFYRKTKI